MSMIETVIEAISPAWAARRNAARMEVERSKLALRGFNAVSKGRRITEEWRNVREGKPTEDSRDLATLRARAREMARNNPYWKSACRTIASEIIGSGIRATAAGTNKGVNEKIQKDWDAWAQSRHVDVAGRLDWYAMQRVAVKTMVNDGESLVLRRVDPVTGRLRLQLLGAEYLSSDRDGEIRGGEIVGGVEVDDFGTAVAYHLYQRHPTRAGSNAVVRVDARDVVHLYITERPNQFRGESWIASSFTRLMDWEDYEDAEMLRQKISACFGAVYTGLEPTKESDNELLDKMEPGMIEHLPPGAKVELISPPASQGMRDAALINHRGIASGLGITYESLTGDYQGATFSSARMGRLQMLSNIDTWQEQIIDALCDPVWGWFLESRSLQPGSEFRVPSVAVTWAKPRPVLVDPERETNADIKRIRAGLMSWSDGVRQAGGDPDQVADAIQEDNKRWDARGLTLDVDPRKVSMQGQGATNQKQEESSNDAGTRKPKAA